MQPHAEQAAAVREMEGLLFFSGGVVILSLSSVYKPQQSPLLITDSIKWWELTHQKEPKWAFTGYSELLKVEIKAIAFPTSNAISCNSSMHVCLTLSHQYLFRCVWAFGCRMREALSNADKRLCFLLLWPILIRYAKHPIPYLNREAFKLD